MIKPGAIDFIFIFTAVVGVGKGNFKNHKFLVGCRTQEDLRVDGRGCEDYRCAEVETDVVSNTSGSARVKLVGEFLVCC